MKSKALLSAIPLTGVIANELAHIHIPKGEYRTTDMRLSIYAPPIGVEDVFVSLDEIAVVFKHVTEQRYAWYSKTRRFRLTSIKRLLRRRIATPSDFQLYLECDLTPIIVVPLKHLSTSLRRWWVDDWVSGFLNHVSDAVLNTACVPRKNEHGVLSIERINGLGLSCVYEQDMILAIGLVILGKYPSYEGMTYEHADFLLWCEQIKDAVSLIEAQTSLPIYDGFPIKQDDYASIYAHPNIIMHWLGSQLGEAHPWVAFQLKKTGFYDVQSWLSALINAENYDIPETDGLGLPYQGLGGDVVSYSFQEKGSHPRHILMIGWNSEVVRQYWQASLCCVQRWSSAYAFANRDKIAFGFSCLKYEAPFGVFDQRKTLLAKCDQLIICDQSDPATQNLMDFAVQEGIDVLVAHKTDDTFTRRESYNHNHRRQLNGEVALMPLFNTLAPVSMSNVDRICFSASQDPVVFAHGNAYALEQLDLPFWVLKEVHHWLNLFNTDDDLWDRDVGFYPIVQAMKLLRGHCPAQVQLLWWSKLEYKWISLETLLAQNMDNPWMQLPGSNKVQLVSLEQCYLPDGYDQDSFSFWPSYEDYAHGIFATLDDWMIDVFFAKSFNGEYMSFDQYDCECGNTHEFIDRNLAMFERILTLVQSKTDKDLMRAFGYFLKTYFVPTDPVQLRDSLVDYLQFVIQKINETKAKGWYLGFVGY
jgi:hypothetical protein